MKHLKPFEPLYHKILKSRYDLITTNFHQCIPFPQTEIDAMRKEGRKLGLTVGITVTAGEENYRMFLWQTGKSINSKPSVWIHKMEDDYYILRYQNLDYRSYPYQDIDLYYQCDQLDGLIQCIQTIL